MGTPMNVPVSAIRTNPAALREVNKASDDFINLVKSVRQRGIINAISVREIQGPNGEKCYGLIDGLHRFTAACEAGLDEVPATVTSMEDGEVEEVQIIANIQKIETKPVEYTKALVRMLSRNPLMTEAELAEKLCRSTSWIKERLGLIKLSDDIQPLVDDGTIKLANAYALAKLPPEEQPNFRDNAATMAPTQFIPLANARVKELKDAARAGRSAEPYKFQPVAHLRKLPEIREQSENPTVAAELCAKNGVSSAVDAFQLACKWVLNMDPDSIEAQRNADDARRAKLDAEKAKAKEEREAREEQKKLAKLSQLTA